MQQIDPDFIVPLLNAVLDEMRAGQPLPVFTNMAVEADSWAAMAAPTELEAYLTAICARLPSAAMGLPQRKRVLAALYKSMPEDARAAFKEWTNGI
jgi:hypothetical protein